MIYLDNAATTFPKPECMIRELNKCLRTYCGNPGRSGHIMSIKAAEKVFECREALANFFGTSQPEKIVFTYNTTYALNLAIKLLYKKHSHILISNMEHNSVLRPLFSLKNREEIDYSIFNVLQSTENILTELERKIRPDTSMLIMTHVSNVCGAVFPIKEVGFFCKKHNITFIVDAAQSAGVEKIEFEKNFIDALCAPAHKGLFGPQGLGFVIFGDKPILRTLIEGGNGTNSLSADMGETLPESLEGGTMATPLIAGLAESLRWIQSIGVDNIRNREIELATMLKERLETVKGSRFYGRKSLESGILLYSNTNINSDHLAKFLDKKNICTRSGFHCSPLAHKALSTTESGALRFSFSPFNTSKEIEETYKIIKSI